ncbi:hypothetical protein KKF84_09880 [Myxococcota bacterium]|nr:hypothetical protein [Myxococcota bacterium]
MKTEHLLFCTLLLLGLLSCGKKDQSPEAPQAPAVKPVMAPILSISPVPPKLKTPGPMTPLKKPGKAATPRSRSFTGADFPKPNPVAGHPLAGKKAPRGFEKKRSRTFPEAGIIKDILTVHSTIFGRRLPLHIILPASYRTHPNRHYPFLVLLGGNHFIKKGAFSAIRYWDGLFNLSRRYSNMLTGNLHEEVAKSFSGAQKTEWLAEISRHLPQEMILILPHTDYFNNLTLFGRYLFREVLPYLFETYRLHKDPTMAGIDGISLGGSQGLLLALDNLGVFQTMGAIQPAVGSLRPRLLKAFSQRRDLLRKLSVPINITTGQWDITRRDVISFYKALKKMDLRLFFHNYPGGHDYYYYQGVGSVDLLLYYGYRFRENHVKRFAKTPEYFGTNTLPPKTRAAPAFVKPAKFSKSTQKEVVTLVSEYDAAVPLYPRVSVREASHEVIFSGTPAMIAPGTSARLAKVQRGGYLGNVLAANVELKGISGWVRIDHLALRARIRKTEPRSKSVRVFATACTLSTVREKLPDRAPLYIMARDVMNLWKFLECDQQMERVFTLSGTFGYVECTYLIPYKTVFTK